MPRSVGDKLGPYEKILAPLGAGGGMREVYRARDSKLHRDVALKVLPEAFAADTGRMARFEREARVLASLNRSNIASIYGAEQASLIMELVEGADLKGPVPVEPSSMPGRSPRAWKRRTRKASFTATSSPPTPRSRRRAQ